jgi:hypothetical protein
MRMMYPLQLSRADNKCFYLILPKILEPICRLPAADYIAKYRAKAITCYSPQQLHQFDSHEGKSWIGVLIDFQAELPGKPELRQKVRHGLDAVYGNAAEFDSGCPRQLAIVPENPQQGFGVVRRMHGSAHVRICLFTARTWV